MHLEQGQEMGMSLDCWNDILVVSKENPYPLAPQDLVKAGRVDKSNYRSENENFARFCRQIMVAEIPQLSKNMGKIELFGNTGTSGDVEWFSWPTVRRVEVLGAGLTRDLGWVPMAVREGFDVAIRDKSEVACKNANQFLAQNQLEGVVVVTQGEVEELWRTGEISDELTTAYYACQFIEHQKAATGRFMHHFGKFLRSPERRVYLTLPWLKDNQNVVWGHAVPLRDEDLQGPLEEGLGGPAKIRTLGRHSYFNRTYPSLRISAK